MAAPPAAAPAEAGKAPDVVIENEDPTTIFEILQRIGEGSYGAVYKALDKRDGSMVAVKALAIDTADANTLQKEIHILQTCASPHIVNYKGSYVKDNDLWIVMEYCLCSMADIMEMCQRTLKEAELQVVMKMALHGLEYLHKTKIIHRDVKAGNLLLTASGDVKLADFGVSAELVQTLAKRATMIGSPYWMAPEILKQMKYESKVDVWSLGITAYELVTSRPPYSELPYMKAIFLIPKNDSPVLPAPHATAFSAECHDFIAKCLIKEPAQRPSAADLLNHPWIVKAGDKKVVVKLLEETMPKIDAAREAPPAPAAGAAAAAQGNGSAEGKHNVKSGPIKPSGTLTKALEANQAKLKAEAEREAAAKAAAAASKAGGAAGAGGGGTLKKPVNS